MFSKTSLADRIMDILHYTMSAFMVHTKVPLTNDILVVE